MGMGDVAGGEHLYPQGVGGRIGVREIFLRGNELIGFA